MVPWEPTERSPQSTELWVVTAETVALVVTPESVVLLVWVVARPLPETPVMTAPLETVATPETVALAALA